MKKVIEALREFHSTFGLDMSDAPTLATEKTGKLRVRLIQEELDEYSEALELNDLLGVADALGDLLYVVVGAAVTHGLDLEGIFWEVHRSNMSKVGGHKDEGGKWVKPDTYSPADLRPFVKEGFKPWMTYELPAKWGNDPTPMFVEIMEKKLGRKLTEEEVNSMQKELSKDILKEEDILEGESKIVKEVKDSVHLSMEVFRGEKITDDVVTNIKNHIHGHLYRAFGGLLTNRFKVEVEQNTDGKLTFKLILEDK